MIISAREIENLSIKDQAYVLNRFMFYLTIVVRDLYTSDASELKDKFYAINGLYHHIIPFIGCLMFDKKSSFTLDVICQNIQDTGAAHDLEHHFSTAWRFSLQQAGISET